MTKKKTPEDQLLNETFVALEYSDTFVEFVMALGDQAYHALSRAVMLRDLKENNHGET